MKLKHLQTSSFIPIEKERNKITTGLAKLVLTLIETLRELMERQARHRMKEGSLSEQEIERLGLAFIQLNEKIGEIASLFNLEIKDLKLGLGSLDNDRSFLKQANSQKQILSLVDLLDRVVEKGVVVFGDLGISVAEVELINVQLRLVVNAVKNPDARSARKHNQEAKTRYVGSKSIVRAKRIH
jgi:hypothetical protein